MSRVMSLAVYVALGCSSPSPIAPHDPASSPVGSAGQATTTPAAALPVVPPTPAPGPRTPLAFTIERMDRASGRASLARPTTTQRTPAVIIVGFPTKRGCDPAAVLQAALAARGFAVVRFARPATDNALWLHVEAKLHADPRIGGVTILGGPDEAWSAAGASSGVGGHFGGTWRNDALVLLDPPSDDRARTSVAGTLCFHGAAVPVLVVSSPKTPHNRATAASCRGTNPSVKHEPTFAEIDDVDLLVAPGCAISDHALDTLEQGLALDPITLPRPAGPAR